MVYRRHSALSAQSAGMRRDPRAGESLGPGSHAGRFAANCECDPLALARRADGHGELSGGAVRQIAGDSAEDRSEEHTSELQSQSNLVCRLLLEKKKTNQ